MWVKKLKSLAIACTIIVGVGSGGLTVHANGTSDALGGISLQSTESSDGKVVIEIPEGDQKALSEATKKLEQKPLQAENPGESLDKKNLFSVNADGSKVTFDVNAFRKATEKSSKQNMNEFVDKLQGSSVSSETQQYIFDLITNSDPDASVILVPMLIDSTKADIYSAMKILEPFIGLMRIVFGILAVVVALFLTLSTVIDLSYIGLPMARGENDKGKPIIPFVSTDAWSVVKEEASGSGDGGYKNVYITYFKRRALTYVVLAICLLYLVAGQLGGVISWFLNLASGLI